MHPTYVASNDVTLQTGAWLYGVRRTYAETAAVPRGIIRCYLPFNFIRGSQLEASEAENSTTAAVVKRLGGDLDMKPSISLHIKA